MKKQTRIVFLDACTVDLGDVDLRAIRRMGAYHAFSLSAHDPLPGIAERAEVLVSNKFYLGEEQFSRLKKLKLVCVAATGTNNIDLAAARRHGVAVCNVAGYSSATVVEHTLMFLLALAHRLLPHHQSVLNGSWSSFPHFALLKFPYHDLAGKTLGIIGAGTIGRQVGALAKKLGMKVLYTKIPGREYNGKFPRVNLESLLAKSDFVSLHCALTPLTQRLINAERLARMKPTACLLNLARGPVVVEADVAAALKKDRLAAYASDVMVQEPPPESSPLLAPVLADKILFTPHVAWASQESRQRLVDEIAKNMAAFFRGKRRNRVD